MLGLLLPLQDSYIKLKYGSVCDIFQFQFCPLGHMTRMPTFCRSLRSLKMFSYILIFLPQRMLSDSWRQPYFPRTFWPALLCVGCPLSMYSAIILEYLFIILWMPYPLVCSALFSVSHSPLSCLLLLYWNTFSGSFLRRSTFFKIHVWMFFFFFTFESLEITVYRFWRQALDSIQYCWWDIWNHFNTR